MSSRSPRLAYTSSTKLSSSPLRRLMTPWGNSVTRNRTTTTSSMRVVRALVLARMSSRLSRPRNICRRCSATLSALINIALSIVRPQHGTNFTSSAWIQKLNWFTNLSNSLSSLNVTTQMTGVGDVELLGAVVEEAFQPPQDVIVISALVSGNGCDWTVIETKFGMQMMKVTM